MQNVGVVEIQREEADLIAGTRATVDTELCAWGGCTQEEGGRKTNPVLGIMVGTKDQRGREANRVWLTAR